MAIEVDEELTVLAATIEDWVIPRQNWELILQEGHDFGRANNVEARMPHVAGEQTSSPGFHLELLDMAEDTGDQLFLRFGEENGIAQTAYLSTNGVDVELFHILTFT